MMYKKLISLLIIVSVFAVPFSVSGQNLYAYNNNTENANNEIGEVIDKCIDFDSVYDKSDNLFCYVVPEGDYYAYDDDYTMFRRSTNTKEWIVYKTDGLRYPVFNTYFKYTDDIPHFSFQVSKDGQNWRSTDAEVTVTEKETWQWIFTEYVVKDLNDGETFVKIIFSDETEYEWSPMLASVYLKSDYKGAGYIDCLGTKYENATAMLSALKIVNGKTKYTFCPNDILNRGEMAIIISKVLNLSVDACKDTVFKDVPRNHITSGAVDALYNIGIINGDENGCFNPETPVTYKEAAKMLVCVLGYGGLAEYTGGYPAGYLTYAKRLNLFKETDNEDYNKEISRGEAAIMVRNSLDNEILNNIVYGDDPVFVKDGTTVLSTYHSISKVSGFMSSCNGLNVIDGISCQNNQVIINGKTYTGDLSYVTSSNCCAALLGRNVIGYADKNDNLLYVEDDGGYVKDIAADKITGVKNGKIYYTDENNKEYYITYTSNTRVVYNGRYKSRMGIDDDIIPSSGFIRVTGENLSADTIFVWEYNNYLAAHKGKLSEGITCKTGDVLKLEYDDCKIIHVTKNGEEQNINDIFVNKDDVVSVAQSDDKSVIVVEIKNDVLSGKVESLHISDDKKEAKIDNTVYKLTNDYKSFGRKLTPGINVLGYTDVNNRIFAVDATDMGNLNYGYLIGINKTDVFGQSVSVKILTGDNKVKIYNCDSDTLLNERKNSVSAISTLTPGLVRIRCVNDTVKEIETPNNNLNLIDTEDFNMCFSSSASKYMGGSVCAFASVYQLGKDTPVFIIPEDLNDLSNYKTGSRAELYSDYEYNTKLYDVSGDYTVGAAVIYMDGSQKRVVKSYDNVAIVKSCSTVNNAVGEACLKLEVFQNGETTYVYFDNLGGIDMTENIIPGYTPKRTDNGKIAFYGGEVIQYYSDADAHCRSFRMYLTRDLIDERGLYEYNLGEYGAITPMQYLSELYTGCGVVENRFANKIIIDTKNNVLRTIPLNSANIYLYSQRDDTVINGDVSDIVKGDYIFTRMSYGDTKEIIVFKQ